MMHEFFIIFGIILGGLSVPSILSAVKDGGAPRVPMMIIAMAGGCFIYGASQSPSGVTLEEIPEMFERVVRSFV